MNQYFNYSYLKAYSELLVKQFIKEINHKDNKFVSLTDKGLKFLEKYKTIVSFISEFDL